MLFEMLNQANREGKEISPALVNLVNKLGDTAMEKGDALPRKESRNLINDLLDLDQPRSGELLFRREDSSRFLPQEYEETLKDMANSDFADAAADLSAFDLETHLEGLEESDLTGRIASALMGFLETSRHPEAYQEYAEALVGLVDDLLETGRHSQILDVHGLLLSHAGGHPDPAIRAAAQGALEGFKETRLVAKIVSLFEESSGVDDTSAEGLLISLGPNAVPHLLDLAVSGSSARITRLMKDLLVKYPERSAAELTARLDKSSAGEAAALLAFVDRLGDRQIIFKLRPFLKHPHLAVRSQVLGLLLKHRDPYAVPFLGNMLDSSDTQEICTGIDLAGDCAVTEIAPKLRGMIRKHLLLLRSDCLVNERIFRALKKMDFPMDADGMRTLTRKKYSLCPEEFVRMKRALEQWAGGSRSRSPAARSGRGA
jgi:hypothetical protein